MPNTGIPGSGESPGGFNEDYAGQSLGDIWNNVQGKMAFNSSDSSKSSREVLNNLFNDPQRTAYFSDFDASQYSNAGDAFAAINPVAWQTMNRPNVAAAGVRDILNQVYTPASGTADLGGGVSVPYGYAAPVSPAGGRS